MHKRVPTPGGQATEVTWTCVLANPCIICTRRPHAAAVAAMMVTLTAKKKNNVWSVYRQSTHSPTQKSTLTYRITTCTAKQSHDTKYANMYSKVISWSDACEYDGIHRHHHIHAFPRLNRDGLPLPNSQKYLRDYGEGAGGLHQKP